MFELQQVYRDILQQGRRDAIDRLVSPPYFFHAAFPAITTTRRIDWNAVVVDALWRLRSASDDSPRADLLHRHGVFVHDRWLGRNNTIPLQTHEFEPFSLACASLCHGLSTDIWISATLPRGSRVELHYLAIPHVSGGVTLHARAGMIDASFRIPHELAVLSVYAALLTHFGCPVHSFSFYAARPYIPVSNSSANPDDRFPEIVANLTRSPRSTPRIVVDPSIKSWELADAVLAHDCPTSLIRLDDYHPHPSVSRLNQPVEPATLVRAPKC